MGQNFEPKAPVRVPKGKPLPRCRELLSIATPNVFSILSMENLTSLDSPDTGTKQDTTKTYSSIDLVDIITNDRTGIEQNTLPKLKHSLQIAANYSKLDNKLAWNRRTNCARFRLTNYLNPSLHASHIGLSDSLSDSQLALKSIWNRQPSVHR